MSENKYSIDGSSLELIKFINKEKQPKRVNYKRVFTFFHKCLTKSIIEMNVKFSNLQGINESIISGINMIFHIFYILINYTNNIKLTIFLLERAVLLYTEFIIMSQDKSVVEEIYFVPNINDAVAFSFKKTVGPIIIQDFNSNNRYSTFLKDILIILRNIYKLYFKKSDFYENTSIFSLEVENNYNSINNIIDKNSTIKKIEQSYYSNYNLNDRNIDSKFDSKTDIMTLNKFINIVDQQICEQLLEFNSINDYNEFLKKIDCVLNSKDNLSTKLGKIKIILVLLNNKINLINLDIDSEIFQYLKRYKENKNNIVYKDVFQRVFDCIVVYNFKTQFYHSENIVRDQQLIDVNMRVLLTELFDYIK